MVDASDTSQGRAPDDLQRLVPLLDSSRLEAQCIGAFYLCVEAAIKSLQGKTKVGASEGWSRDGGLDRIWEGFLEEMTLNWDLKYT